jgi:hypothetical protein
MTNKPDQTLLRASYLSNYPNYTKISWDHPFKHGVKRKFNKELQYYVLYGISFKMSKTALGF